MWWRCPRWRPVQDQRTTHGSRSCAVWADLIYPDAVLAQAAELATRQAGDLAALERVLNEPTLMLECGVRVPPFVVAHRRAGRREVRHA